MVGFGIISIEPSSSAIRDLVNWLGVIDGAR
jgi:hypothetical protein